MTATDCIQANSTYPMILFFVGSLVWAALIKSNEKLTIRQTLSVMIGIRRYEHTLLIDILHFAFILVPAVLLVFLIQDCGASPSVETELR